VCDCLWTTEYKENLKSNIADMVNSAAVGRRNLWPRCSEGIREDTPWIHLDIAAPAWMEDSKPWIAKGRRESASASLVEL